MGKKVGLSEAKKNTQQFCTKKGFRKKNMQKSDL